MWLYNNHSPRATELKCDTDTHTHLYCFVMWNILSMCALHVVKCKFNHRNFQVNQLNAKRSTWLPLPNVKIDVIKKFVYMFRFVRKTLSIITGRLLIYIKCLTLKHRCYRSTTATSTVSLSFHSFPLAARVSHHNTSCNSLMAKKFGFNFLFNIICTNYIV